jgi:peptidoglycan/LPS O-acetylase OafA/YrhL
MDNKQLNNERVYSLDALRAIMMLLGIVIHASITYGIFDYKSAWSLKDTKNNSLAFDIIVSYIHAFRMPVFFVAAGFFAALLFYKKGPRAMLVNRVKRIVFPFLVGVLITYPLTVMSFTFSKTAFAGSLSPFTNAWNVIVTGRFLPFNVIHLWFLYFLAIYAIVFCLLGVLFKNETSFTKRMLQFFTAVFADFWLRFFVMAIVLALCFFWMGTSFILTNNKWSIDPAIFTLYFIFFGAGWMIYKTNGLSSIKKHSILQLILAALLFLGSTLIAWPKENWVLPVKIVFASIYTPLFIYGFIAFFQTYFNHYSKRLTYLMDAAYWIYIIHLPIVAFIPGLMAGLSIPAILKFSVTFALTFLLCIISYHYLVRGSFIGMFLNGKVHKK